MWGVSLTSKIGQSRSYLWGVSLVTPYSAWILIKYYEWQYRVVGHCMGVKGYLLVYHAHIQWAPLLAFERRASKQVPSLKELSYEDRLRTHKLPTLAYRRYRGDMIEVFKVTHSIYDIAASRGLLEMDQGSITRGHRYKINKKGCHLNIRLNSFTHRVVDQWNNLPDWVVDAKTVACFEGRLDKLWHGSEVMFSPDADVRELTKQRNTRYKENCAHTHTMLPTKIWRQRPEGLKVRRGLCKTM